MGMGLPAGRPPHARLERVDHRQLLPRRAVRRAQGHAPGSISTRCATLARKERPKLLLAGGTAIPRTIDFAAFAEIARRRSARCSRPTSRTSPASSPRARTPRRCRSPTSSRRRRTRRCAARAAACCCPPRRTQKAIDRAVFPGLQGGPHNHTTAGIAIALKEAATAELPDLYAHQIVANSRALAAALVERGFTLITGGSDNHLILADLTSQERLGQDRREGARRRRAWSSTTTACRSIRASRSIRRGSGSARRR